jgi:glycosyltransferase involved in cell wall biosynthesis
MESVSQYEYHLVKLDMNILHIYDQAGVACILAKHQQATGNKARVIVPNTRDKFGIYAFYAKYTLSVDPRSFIGICLNEAADADVIHIHSRIDILFKLYKKFGSKKKIILHYHGTDLRGLKRKQKESLPHRSLPSDMIIFAKRLARRPYYRIMRKRLHRKAQNLADAVLVATPDLLDLAEKKSIYLANPIDTDHFQPVRDELRHSGQAQGERILTITNEAIDVDLVLSYCKENGFDKNVEVYDRITNPVMYSDMPNLLRRYDTYLDVRFINGKLVDGMSKTGLESLACGLTVIDHKLNYHKGLTPQHDATRIVSELSAIYSGGQNIPR